MIKQLVSLSSHLDRKGYIKEADYLDSIISKVAQDPDDLIGFNPEGFDVPGFAAEGWDPDSATVMPITDADRDLDQRRNELWNDMMQMAADRGFTKSEFFDLLDDKTGIFEADSIESEISTLEGLDDSLFEEDESFESEL